MLFQHHQRTVNKMPTAQITITGFNLVLPVFLSFILFLSPFALDAEAVKVYSVLVGSFIGGVGVAYLRPELTTLRNATKIVMSGLLALPPSFAMDAYLEVNKWEYHFGIGAVTGLLVIILANASLIVADNQIIPLLTKLSHKIFGGKK